MPTGEAPHKRIVDDPGRELRLAMTRLAAADDARFSGLDARGRARGAVLYV